jgi:nitrogen fixation protein NifQ
MNPSHDCRSHLLAELLGRPAQAPASDDPLRPVLASLLAGRSLNQGVLTATLGLSEPAYQALWSAYFPGAQLNLTHGPGEDIVELEE